MAPASLNAIAGKILIAVSEDIDPDNLDAVMWSIGYRCNPIEDVHISPYHGGVQGAQYGDSGLGSKLLIDATIKGPMAPLALPKKEFMERAQVLWAQARPAADQRSSSRGTAIRSATGPSAGTPGRSARSAAPGRRPARETLARQRAASSRRRPRAG